LSDTTERLKAVNDFLADYGWNERMDASFRQLQEPTWTPARVTAVHRDLMVVQAETGSLQARLAGRFRLDLTESAAAPTVGDWVAIEARPEEGAATVQAVLPRLSCLMRKEAGARTQAQALAANVDTAFLVSSLNQEFNPRRLERFLTLVYDGGASPVLLLNKVDLCEEAEAWRLRAEAMAPGVPVHVLSALEGTGVAEIVSYCVRGRTLVLLGSSGVGKSTLANRLLGREALRVKAIREDDARGRHTTAHRQLLCLEEGGVLIDTPGLREVGLWGSEGMGETFRDVESLGAACRFRDCRHEDEPGCAVVEAVDAGTLDAGRYASYRKLRRELDYLERRRDPEAAANEKRRWRAITKSWRKHKHKKG
jgi:ribosome biogenesis GTPase